MQTNETAAIRRRNLVQLPTFVVTYSDGHEEQTMRVRAIGALDACNYALRIYPGANELSARLAQ